MFAMVRRKQRRHRTRLQGCAKLAGPTKTMLRASARKARLAFRLESPFASLARQEVAVRLSETGGRAFIAGPCAAPHLAPRYAHSATAEFRPLANRPPVQRRWRLVAEISRFPSVHRWLNGLAR